MSLTEFFNEPANFLTRERIFYHRLCFDLSLAAARRGMPLQIFAPEVDRHGFDVLIDDADTSRRFQVKTLLRSGKTNAWMIHKRLLRPIADFADDFNFVFSPEGVGLGGGVILMEVDETDPLCPVTYLYTDLFLTKAISEGLVVAKGKTLLTQAETLLVSLRTGVGTARTSVPRGLFVRTKSPDALLAIAGFHSAEAHGWNGSLVAALRAGFTVDGIPAVLDVESGTALGHAEVAIDGLLSLVDEPRLAKFVRPIAKAR